MTITIILATNNDCKVNIFTNVELACTLLINSWVMLSQLIHSSELHTSDFYYDDYTKKHKSAHTLVGVIRSM